MSLTLLPAQTPQPFLAFNRAPYGLLGRVRQDAEEQRLRIISNVSATAIPTTFTLNTSSGFNFSGSYSSGVFSCKRFGQMFLMLYANGTGCTGTAPTTVQLHVALFGGNNLVDWYEAPSSPFTVTVAANAGANDPLGLVGPITTMGNLVRVGLTAASSWGTAGNLAVVAMVRTS